MHNQGLQHTPGCPMETIACRGTRPVLPREGAPTALAQEIKGASQTKPRENETGESEEGEDKLNLGDYTCDAPSFDTARPHPSFPTSQFNPLPRPRFRVRAPCFVAERSGPGFRGGGAPTAARPASCHHNTGQPRGATGHREPVRLRYLHADERWSGRAERGGGSKSGGRRRRRGRCSNAEVGRVAV